jgi:hypothetical protein
VLGPALEFARKRANGDYALAQAIGSTESPGKIFLTIGTAPKQPVSVNWSITCLNGGANGGKSRSNAFQVTPPSVTEIPLTSPRPIRCTVSAQAQPTLAGSARVKVVLTAQKRT